MAKTRNPAAVGGKKRWQHASPEEPSEPMKDLARRRWNKRRRWTLPWRR